MRRGDYRYEYFLNKFAGYADNKIIELILLEKSNPGWTSTRSAYILALKEVARIRGIKLNC
jgi:hypothetical protein